jgi:methionine-rich copper-binding protein CopC
VLTPTLTPLLTALPGNRRLRRGVLAMFLALGALVATSAPASAHAELESADPADGSTVSTAPRSVTLTFGEDLQPAGRALVVTGPDGARVDDGKAVVSGVRLSVDLVPLTTPGRYNVVYRVVSADGHPVSGELSFTYQPGAVDSSPPAVNSQPADTSPVASTESTSGTGSAVPWLLGGALVALVGVVIWSVVRSRRA